jgi:uncharacterized RDD family membrane protein YckC
VSAPELRPLAVGEVLDVAIKITFRHWRAHFLLVLVVVAPAQLLVTAIDVSMAEGVVTDIEGDSVPSVDEISTFVAGITLIVLLLVLSSTLATGAVYKGVVDAYLGVVDYRTGGPIGVGRGAIRYIGKILSSIPIGLGFFWMIWDREKQTWHDKIATTVVVPTSAYPVS